MHDFRFGFNHGTLKVLREDVDRGFITYRASLAKNSFEGFGLSFWALEEANGMTLEVDAPRLKGHTLKTEVFRAEYIAHRGRHIPDALIPHEGEFSLPYDSSQMFYIRLTADLDAPAGLYEGGFRMYVKGELALEAPFSARVWNFKLPSAASCGTLFGLNKRFIKQAHGADDEKTDILYKKYYDFLLEHKICAYNLPYDILDERADAYLDNPAVNNFVVPHSVDDDTLRAYHKKLSSKKEWFAKGNFYPVDEPSKLEHFERYEKACMRLEQLYPGFRATTPLAGILYFKELDKDSIELIEKYQSRWCPRQNLFDLDGTSGYMDEYRDYYPGKYFDNRKELLSRYGNLLDRIDAMRARGDDIWWYVCGHPYYMNFPDFNLHNSGVQSRGLLWQQFALNVEGLLYWSSNHWGKEGSPWHSPFTFDDIHTGNGSLLYNGNEVGIDGPVGSHRLEMARAGIEDFEYLKLAKKVLPAEFINSIVNKVTNPAPELNEALQNTRGLNMLVFCNDDDTLYAARQRIGNAIEQALTKTISV